jgi:hypothetical protein
MKLILLLSFIFYSIGCYSSEPKCFDERVVNSTLLANEIAFTTFSEEIYLSNLFKIRLDAQFTSINKGGDTNIGTVFYGDSSDINNDEHMVSIIISRANMHFSCKNTLFYLATEDTSLGSITSLLIKDYSNYMVIVDSAPVFWKKTLRNYIEIE